MNPTTHESETPEGDIHKPSKLRRIIKWFIILSGLFLILLIALSVSLLTYFFPSELVRQELETRSSELLQGEVRITTLSFNLLTGLELRRVEFLKQDKSLLKFQRLNLDYSLLGLLGGKLTVNEVLVDRADIALNLPEFAASAPEEEAPPPEPLLAEPSIPALPIAIDLEALVIDQSHVSLVVSPTLAVDLTNVNVEITGGVTQEEAELEGSVTIADLAVDLEGKHVQFPFETVFSLKANLPDQHLEVHRLTIESNPAVRLTLSGSIHEFLTQKNLELSLHDVELDLQTILLVAKDFVPPEFANVQVSGMFSPALKLKGSFPESAFQGTVDLTLNARSFEGVLPQFSTKLGSTDFSIQASDLNIRDNVPQFGNLSVKMTNTGVQYEEYSVRDFQLDLTSEYFAVGPISGTLEMSGISALPPIGPLKPLTLPFQLKTAVNGNYKSQDFMLKELLIKLGNLLAVKARGEVHPQKASPQAFRVSLTTRLEPHIATLLPLVPPDMLEGISIKKGPGRDGLVVHVTGDLNREYRPDWAKLTTGLKLTDITASLDTLSAGGTADRANVYASVNYSGKSGHITGTVGTALKLSNLHQGGSLAVGRTELKLKSSMAGTLTPDFELVSLRSQDMLTINTADIVYDDPSLKAGIDQVKLSLKTKEDIFGQEYVVEGLRVNSDPLLDVTVKGRYRLRDQEFSVNADMPYVNVGGLLSRLSGDLVQGLSEMKPQGRIGLSAKASGRVPQQRDLERLAIPVNATAEVTLHNVEGAFAQHQLKGAQGGLSVSLTPGDHPVAKIGTDIHVNTIQLAPGLPVDRLKDALVQLNVSARDFEDIRVNRLRVGAKGAALDVTGKVIGIKRFLTGDEKLGEMLSKLFAQVKTRASVDLEQFPGVLKSAGLAGSGQARIDISMLKKEKGPFDARLAVTTQKVNVSKEGTAIRNINGGFTVRKHLLWSPDSSQPSLPRSFNPTDVLSQLRSLAGKSKNLTIEHIDLGFLTVSNFATHILFERNAFKIQNLTMNLLGGGLGGHFVLTTGKAFGFSAQLEAAKLDLNQLLDERLRITGDSRVDSTIGVTVFFEEETGALDLSRTELNLYITHIGQEALDRLLVFLDPEGSNPTLVSARSQVKLASPSRVTIQMARGMMNLEILFDQGLLPDFHMPRIPVGKVKNLQDVTQGIPNWPTIAHVLAMVGAETYGVDQEGNLRVR